MLGASLKFGGKHYDTRAWLEDYGYVQDHIGRLYANLDWTAERGALDLRRLDRQAYAALQAARSDEEAKAILRGFVQAFGDGHMSLRSANAPPLHPETAPDLILSRSTAPESACKALGFNASGEQDFPFRLEPVSAFRSRGGANSFASGVLDFEGRRFGFLRIGSFDEQNFSSACQREWRVFRGRLPGTCEPDCRSTFRLRVADRLLREIEARIRQLERAGSQILVVDVTDNPGGYGWYDLAAQLFSASRLPPLRAAYVKNSRTVAALEDDRRQILHYLASRKPDPALRATLEEAVCRIDDLAAEAGKPCDAAFIWGDRSRQSGCTRLTTRTLYSTGVFDRYDGPALPFDVQFRIFDDAVYSAAHPSWRGPVAVLIDQDTGSAAELFAGILQRLAGATLIGRPSAATGAGWSLCRQAWVLPRSKMQFYLPDTVHYWPDGANAREGLVPDVPTRWREDEDPKLMARKLLVALRSVDSASAPAVAASR